eukprot:gene10603-11749_t
MEQLIPVVNKLQDVFAAIGQDTIDLPQIVVVGSQSAGKSSVLENIVGRDFLPRGFGIVTRRPLVLQLHCINPEEVPPEDRVKGEEWGEFLHLPGVRFFNFNDIRDEIVKETDRVTGRNKGVSKETINLRVYSPFVLNLTLVDLPGITKVPTGDQPMDIEEQIRSMCLQYIGNPNAIILAVTAANQDLANSDGLKMARSVDPLGERTIGVLTKVDIMDHGTDCCDILDNQVIPQKHGYVAVMNRSQKDIQENLPIRKGLAKEAAFFQSHPKYRQFINKCGTRNLARILNQILMVHIRECLPEIRTRITRMLISINSNLNSLGFSLDEQSNTVKGSILLKIISQFCQNIQCKVDGKGSKELVSEMSELYGGARISYIFNETFGKKLRALDPFEGLDDEDIRTAIANCNGTRPSLFVPEIAFDLLVRRQIARLEQPGMQCLDLIFQEMQRTITQSECMEVERFPELRDRIIAEIYKLLQSSLSPAQKMISSLIQIELAYINTSHPDFVGGKAAVATAQQTEKQQLSSAGGKALDGSVTSQSGGVGNGQAEQKGFMGMFKAPNTIPPPPVHSLNLNTANSKQFHDPNANSPGIIVDERGVRLPLVPDRMRCSSNPSDRERMEMEIIKTLIRSYFDIVKKNFTDLVPKTIMRFLIQEFMENLQNHLVSSLYREDVMNELMRETEDVMSKRKALKEMQELLNRANEIVNEVREFQPST